MPNVLNWTYLFDDNTVPTYEKGYFNESSKSFHWNYDLNKKEEIIKAQDVLTYYVKLRKI